MNVSTFNRKSTTQLTRVADRNSNKNWLYWVERWTSGSLLFLALFFLLDKPVQAQCSGPNLLTNGSFESPVVPAGQNNLVASIPGWTNGSADPSQVNVLRSTVAPTPAIDGSQYIDLLGIVGNGTGIMEQKFTLSSPAVVLFSGSFANRAPTNPNYLGGQIAIQIFDAAGTQIAAASNKLSAADGLQWKTVSGRSSLLPAGVYTFRFFSLSDWVNYDNMSLCIATNAVQSCPDRTVLKPQPAWSVTASGFQPGYPPSLAIDGSTQDDATLRSLWVTPQNNVVGQYITFDYGSPQNLVGFVYYPRTFTETQDITGYSIQVSNDGTNFISVQSGSISPQVVTSSASRTVSVGNPQEVDFESAITARYMRLTVVNAASTSFAAMAELLPIVCQAPTLNTISCANADLLNTGTNSTGDGLGTLDRFDTNWEVSWTPKLSSYTNTPPVTYSDIGNATFVPAIVTGNKIPGTWSNSPYGNANWISYTESSYDVNTTGLADGTSSNTYFFRYRFNITDAYLLPAFKLKLNFLRDNYLQNIYINGVGLAPQFGLPSAGFFLSNQAQTSLQSNWQLGKNELVVQVYSQPTLAGFLGQNIASCPGLDFGDAPASYNVSRTTNGPGHIIEMDPNNVVTLQMGSLIDQEPDGIASISATGDDTSNFDDEDGVNSFPVIQGTNGKIFTNYTVNVAVKNSTGSTANLCGWIDWNNNSVFDAGEGVCTTVANGATSAQLVWPSATLTGLTGSSVGTYARFRLTTDALTSNSMNGAASNGEVEDYFIPFCIIPAPNVTLVTPSTICSGAPVTINFTTNPTGQVVQWVRMPGGVTGVNNFTDFPTATGTTPVSYTYSAWISNAAGSCSSQTVVTTVLVNPVPIITPSQCSQTICSGQTGAITFTTTIPGSTINWTRTPTTPAPSSGTGDISQSLTNTGPTSVTYTYQIWATSPAPASCPSSTTITCTIVVTPGLTVVATANSATVCVGSPLSLSASAVPAGTYTYSWTGPNGYVGTGANPTVSAAATTTQSGTYTVVVTDAGGCSGTATVAVVVGNCCSLSATAGPPIVACAGNSFTLTGTSSGTPVGPLTYTWTGPGGFTASGQTAIATATVSGTYTLVVTDTGATNCSATTTVGVTVNPTPSFTVTPTNTTSCAGNSGSLILNGLIPSTSYTVGYSFNGTPVGPLTGITNGSGQLSLTGLAAGSYTNITVSLNGCRSTAQVATIADPGAPVAPVVTALPSQTICQGQSVTMTASGVAGASFLWTGTNLSSTVGSPVTATPATVGNFIYTVTQSLAGCTSPATSVTVVVNAPPSVTAVASSATVCVGSSLSLSAMATPAGTYTYAWTGPNGYTGTGANPTVTAAVAITQSGTYTVVVTNAAGCSGTAVVPVSVTTCCPTPISRATVALCNNETLNLQTYVPAGGSFTLLTGTAGSLSGSTFNGIVSGAGVFKVGYRANGVGANCAPDTITVIVRNCTPPLCNYPLNSIVVDATCGNTDGRAEVTLGGIPTNAFTSFAWSNGQVGSAISGLQAGVYSVTATVTDGATVCQVVDSVQVNNIGGPVAELRLVTPATCSSNGVASLSIVSGTGPFTVSWSGTTTGTLTGVNLGAVNIPNLPAGPYVFQISSAATPGCFGYLSVNIPRADGNRISLTATATDASSCSSANGSIQITVQPQVGVSAPFSYSLDGQFIGSSSLPSFTLNNLPAGVYTVAVSSSTGCATTPQTVIINAIGAPTITGWSAQSPACPTDQGKLVYAGGQSGTTFQVREVTTGALIASNINGANSTSLVVSAGTYIVQTTSGTCVAADTLILNRPQDIDFNVQFTPETCAAGGVGNSDGSLSVVQITGGTKPFTIVVTNNLGQTIPTANLNALPAGNYSVNVIDANGCTGSSGTLVTVPPCGVVCPKLDFNTVVLDAQCGLANGEATAQLLNVPAGAGTAVTYTWSNGFIGTTTANLTSGIYSVTAQITGSGIYNGCMYVDSVNVNDIGGPVFTVSPLSPASCTAANGSAVINILSGTAPFTISWTGQSTGSQTVPNLGSVTINGLMAGNYVFTVTGGGATSTCKGIFDITLPGTSGNLAATVSTSAVTGCGATNGQILVNVSGGVGPFTYIVNGFVRGFTSTRNFSIQGLPAGTYYVEVTDRNGCTTIRQNVLINTTGQPPITGFTSTSPTCPEQDGTIVFNGTGVASDQYVITISGTATQIGQTAGNVAASYTVPGGTYLITRTTSTSCVSTTVITITQPAGLDYNIQYKEPTCALPSGGSLSVVQASGGTAPYTVTVTGASGIVSNLSALTSGSYTVTLGDANGCTLTKVVSLTGGSSFTVTASTTSATVCVGSPLSLSANVTPAGTYTYAWTGPNGYVGSGVNPRVSAAATITQSGTYTVVVTDAAGCSGTATVPVSVTDCTAPCNLTVTASASQTAVCAGQPINLASTVSGNAGAVTYLWTGPNSFSSNVANPTLPSASSLTAGIYTVYVSDPTTSTACVEMASVEISLNSLNVYATSNSPQCTTGTLSLTSIVDGGTGSYTYAWSGPNGFSNTAQNPTVPLSSTAQSGTYTVVVTDVSGCSGTATTEVIVSSQPDLSVTGSPSQTICSGQSTTLSVGGSGGAPVVWANSLGQSGTGTTIVFNGVQNQSGQPQSVTYVIGASAGACSDQEVVVLTINPAPTLIVMPSAAVYCDIENVLINVTAQPGTALINWTRTPATPTPPAASGSGTGNVTIQQTLPAGNYTYTISATGVNGCTSQTMVVPVTVQQ